MGKDEVLRLALEALESNRRKHHYCEDTWYSCPKHEDGCANDSESDECNCGADKANAEIDQAITAIKAALEAKDEPVAWMDASRFEQLRNGFTVMTTLTKKKAFFDDIAIYTTPPQRTWVGLTEKDICEAAVKSQEGISPRDDTLRFAIAIEAKLKERNT